MSGALPVGSRLDEETTHPESQSKMSHRFLDPAGLARVGNMELVAKQVVEGFLTGRHRSPYHGFSVEYLDHRAYTPGDDLRTMDWKILARSDKPK